MDLFIVVAILFHIFLFLLGWATTLALYLVWKKDRSFVNEIRVHTDRPYPTDSAYIEFGWDMLEANEKNFINHTGDGAKNEEFNRKVFTLIGPNGSILDIGCGCGEAVVDFIDNGHLAVGVDGYKLWQKYKCGGWGKYPKNFFQTDVGHFFYVKHYKEDWLSTIDNHVVFDLIMSWECFEHVKTDDIDKLMVNIDRHSKLGTYFIGSVSIVEEGYVHRTLHKRGWWLKKFHTIGFEEVKGLDEYFGNDLVRNMPGISEIFFLRKV